MAVAMCSGDLAAADLALGEANVLDAKNPRVWGYLALNSLLRGRVDEANVVGGLADVLWENAYSVHHAM